MSKRSKYDLSDDMINMVAHELKTPVGAAKSFIDLMSKFGELNDQQKHYMNRAFSALDRMEELINDLLNFSRLESGIPLEIEDVDLADLIHDHVDLLHEMAKQRDIHFVIPDTIRELIIEGDLSLLSQVISNLLSNAVKYNRDGGTVTVRSNIDTTKLYIEVIDTGIGIPPKEKSRVFERFYRAKHDHHEKISGTGLGLAITERIIQLHGGHIRVESTLGAGTTFSFTLPIRGGVVDDSSVIDMPRVRPGFNPIRLESASESSDGVDDDTQESFERFETDSRNEEQ